MIAAAIGCSRAGIWLFEDAAEGRLLRCLGIYDRNKDRMTIVPDETSRQVGAYFEALEQTGHILPPKHAAIRPLRASSASSSV